MSTWQVNINHHNQTATSMVRQEEASLTQPVCSIEALDALDKEQPALLCLQIQIFLSSKSFPTQTES